MADARLVFPAAFGSVTVGILIGFPGSVNAVAVCAWVCTGVVISAAILSSRWRIFFATIAVTSVITAILLTSAAVHSFARNPAILDEAAHDGRFVTLTVTLSTEVSAGAGGVSRVSRTPISITDATVGKSAIHGLSIPALLFGSLPPLGAGTQFSVSGTIANTEAGDHTAFLVYARGTPQIREPAPWFLQWSTVLRTEFRKAAASLPGDGGALLPGLSIGDTSAVSDTLRQAMIATSLSHLTAVSGANCAVVVGLIMVLGGVAGASRTLRIVVALVVLVGFVVLVRPDASVLRAAVMASIVLFSLARGRPSKGIPVLCLAVIVLLAIDPWLSRNYGFILSVLATAGLMVIAGPIAGWLSRWLPTPLAVVISIPLAAQLACQPVLILLNPSIPVYGELANLLAELAAPIATVLGLLGCLALPMVPILGHILTSMAWLPSAWIAAVARFFAAAPGAQAPWLPGALGALLLAVITVAALRASLGRPTRISKLIVAALLLSLISYGGVVVGVALGRARSLPSTWQIAACDIGQGDAVLVRSKGLVALIDTGPDPKTLSKCLDELGIDRIQLLVLSHYDLDHVGGTAAVLGRVDRAMVGPVSDASDLALRESLQDSGAALSEVAKGEHGMLGDLSWQILWPPVRSGTVEPGNPASVTVRFDGVGACEEGCLSSLFLGDLGEEAQLRMLGVSHPAPVDVVKVAHHGSADQAAALYERVHARVGIISVGEGNRYGHPTDKLLGILAKAGTNITRTDLEGMILISPSPEGNLTVWTEHPPDRDLGTH